MRYRPEIDGMRAIAVLSVIFFHAGFDFFGGGFVGVDVFFVISGYLITSIIMRDVKRGEFSLMSFYERRMRRLLPALFLVLCACLPLAWFFMTPNQIIEFSRSLIAVSFFVSNFLFWRESGYFAAAAEEKPLLHTWSLGVEEQFYLIFPIFLVFFLRRSFSWTIWIIILAAVLSFFIAEWGWRQSPVASFYLFPTRAWELLAGSIAAFVTHSRKVNGNEYFAAAGLFSIIISFFIYGESTPFPSVYTLVPIIGSMLVIIYANEESYIGKVLCHKWLVTIGLISYSLYLWHQPLFVFSRLVTGGVPSQSLMMAVTAASIFLAYLSWRFVETPFRARNLFNRDQIFKFSFFGLLSFASIGVVGVATSGFLYFITTQGQRDALSTATPSPVREECHTGGVDYLSYSDSCEYFSSSVSVAVFGDSHAVEVSYALAEELRGHRIGVKHLSFSGCMPLLGIERNEQLRFSIDGFDECLAWSLQALNGLISDHRIETVVISYRIANAMYGHRENYPYLGDDRGDENRLEIWQALLRTFEVLDGAGKEVIFVLQAPELPLAIDNIILNDETTQFYGVPLNWWRARMAFVYENSDQLLEFATIIDPAEYFCEEVYCRAVIDDTSLYYDDNHMSVAGARLLIPEIIREIFGDDDEVE